MVQHLFFSQDLTRWTYLRPFVEDDIFTLPGEDGAAPYFWPIGDKHILIFASHERGGQYLIGDYDRVHCRFKPFEHGRFNFGSISPDGVHAPSTTLDGEGDVYVIYNINQGNPTEDWNHVISLVRRLTLGIDNTLRIEPVPAIESLRTQHTGMGETHIPANREIVLGDVSGNTMELVVEMEPQKAREICICVLRSPEAEEYTTVKFYRRGLLQKNREGQHISRMRW